MITCRLSRLAEKHDMKCTSVPVQRIVIEVKFCIEGKDFSALSYHQRIDFNERIIE
jgi:hypothetical protein